LQRGWRQGGIGAGHDAFGGFNCCDGIEFGNVPPPSAGAAGAGRRAKGLQQETEMTDQPSQPAPRPGAGAGNASPEASFPNPLRDLHDAAGAEFQSYDRTDIVSTFGEPQAEYAAVRKGCALVDEPQRGVLELTGKDRHEFLNNLLTNQTWDKERKTGLAPGTGVYAFFLNLKGRIVADLNGSDPFADLASARTRAEADAIVDDGMTRIARLREAAPARVHGRTERYVQVFEDFERLMRDTGYDPDPRDYAELQTRTTRARLDFTAAAEGVCGPTGAQPAPT